jgi:hypothetical protein
MDIRDHLYDVQIDEMFAPLTMRLLPSSCWNLFVRTAQWQQFVTGESNRFDVASCIRNCWMASPA